MSPTPTSYSNFVGIDVAKNNFVVALDDSKKIVSYRNDESGIAELIAAHGPLLKQSLIVLESTGGYERKVLNTLCYGGYAVHKANAFLIKSFIKSYGIKSKTDCVDAKAIRQYAKERGHSLALFAPADEDQEQLRQLSERREDLIKTRTQEKNRLKGPANDYTEDSIKKSLDFLEAEIKEIENKIDSIISKNKHEEAEILKEIPGIGPIVANTLIAFMPELGRIDHKPASSLVGLAPFAYESGKLYRPRHVFGGRALIRQKLMLAALSAIRTNTDLAEFYQRLIDAGKKPMVALTALAHKILIRANAKLRDYYAIRTHALVA